jgi:chromosome segregation ATPase
MISKLLTGGIDLPKLARDFRELQAQMFSTRGVTLTDPETVYKSLADVPTRFSSLVERLDAIDDRAEETSAALADHIGKANELIASRALAEDVETLRLKVERVLWDTGRPNLTRSMEAAEDKDAHYPTLGTEVEHMQSAIASLRATVASLQTQINTLTAAKLSEVKARKAPKKA